MTVIPRKEGFAVAILGGTGRCFGTFEETWTSCNRLRIGIVGGDGSILRVEERLLEGGEPTVDDLVDVGGGVAVAAHSWRGGPVQDAVYVPMGFEKPTRELASCGYPPADLISTDLGILSLCEDPEEHGAPELGCEPNSCGLVRLQKLDGSIADPFETPIMAIHPKCRKGESMIVIRWKHGSVEIPASESNIETPPCPTK